MGHTRPRFNAKARQSTAGKTRKHKRQEIDTQDSNAEIIALKSQEDKERDRKERLKLQIIVESESKWNTKKKRRLEKYIDKKLKKEERTHIFEKLSKSQAELPSTLDLHTSSTLGTGKPTTHQDHLDQTEDRDIRRVLDGVSGSRKRQVEHDVDSSSDDFDDADDAEPQLPIRPASPPSHTPTVGAALQQGSKKTHMKKWAAVKSKATTPSDSDTSFDSSDSENDSDGENFNTPPDEADSSDASTPPPTKKRSLGFKQWATKQLNTAKGYDIPPPEPSELPQEPTTAEPPPKKRKVDSTRSIPLEKHGPLGEKYHLPETSFTDQLSKSKSRVKTVSVGRPPDVQESRLLLPIVAEEQPIMEAILLNPVVIICGETGSGKTTQVPQFLYEAGFGTPGSENPGMIGVTQPRRVAAVSMANRVAHELSLTKSKVSYQIRYDATVSPDTSIKFMTDGVLLRELASDFLLTKYSVIIIDEAHERSMNTDILIGVLSRVMKLRENMWKEGKGDTKPLRLIIMSATLRVSDFAENRTLFPTPPPIINVAARQHPVTVHFSKRTSSDYVNEAVRKAGKIHTRLPPGGILIFLTGQNEITGVQSSTDAAGLTPAHVFFATADVEAEDIDLGVDEADDPEEDVDDEGLDSDEDMEYDDLEGHPDLNSYMHIVPLYSLLPSEKQMKVFEPPPPNSRLVVVSTNVAETSLTIPGIRFILLNQLSKRHHDVSSGIQSFQVRWVSKASASQRAGRAGRTGPGHCYRLYSSALFEHHFSQFSEPEILRTPIEGIVLQMKSMNIDVVANFPFPAPPDRQMLRAAEKTLVHLGALRDSAVGASLSHDPLTTNGNITALGKSMALFPLSPRFSRMIVSGQQHGCLPYVIAIVAGLAVGDPFLHEEGLSHQEDDDQTSSEAVRSRRKAYFQIHNTHASLGNFTSDIFKLLSVIGAYEYGGGSQSFCVDHFVRPKMMEEIHKLRAQISHIVATHFPGTDSQFSPKLSPPSDLQLKSLRQLIVAAFIDSIAVRKDLVELTSSSGIQYSTTRGVPYRALNIDEDVFIHPSSVTSSTSPPNYIVYTNVVRTSSVWLKGVTVINPAWLAVLGKSWCSFSKPAANREQ
ncbi:hypothetical protein ONZ45_g4442 [Pleurotus djamor]|nr:hypothetical protein ONZ45_g4442 [Pleurotus djamor]